MAHVPSTGEGGFISNQTCVALLNTGYGLLTLNEFSKSLGLDIDRMQQLTGCSPTSPASDGLFNQPMQMAIGARHD